MSTEGEGNETMQLKYDSKILGRETYAGRSCYKIRTNYRVFLSEDIPMEGVEGSARMKGQGTGAATWLFDPAAKVVVKTATTDTLAITALVDIVTMGEGQHEIRVTTSSQTSGRLVELNGEAVAGK
jgi:hypothetical protein